MTSTEVAPGLGGMTPATLPEVRPTRRIRPDGRPTAAFREQLRRIPSWRNAVSVVSVWLQIVALLVAAVVWRPWSWLPVIVLMGRAHAQLASLMHEAAHRLLFANQRANDWVGRWLLGFPSFTSTDAYRRVHMAHHRDEFGPNEPDIPLYIGYPVERASLRRKLGRDLSGRTGIKLMRQFLTGLRSPEARVRRTVLKILAVQAVLLAAAIASGWWWLYPLAWLLPYLTMWRVINRLRSIAEHGGMRRSKDRRESTHSVRQHRLAQFWMVPFNIGFHLAHHVDAGVPFRRLPELHRALHSAGYVDESIEYPTYRSLWAALQR